MCARVYPVSVIAFMCTFYLNDDDSDGKTCWKIKIFSLFKNSLIIKRLSISSMEPICPIGLILQFNLKLLKKKNVPCKTQFL